jgi:hypothetical protein
MKQLYLLLIIGLLAATTGRASSLVAAGDTVPGHARAIRLLSSSLCTKLAQEEQRSPLAKLTTSQGKTLFTQLMVEAMGEHAEDLKPMFEQLQKKRGASEALGRDVVLRLAQDCPMAAQFVVQLGLNEVKNQVTLTEKEKGVIGIVTTDICQRLDKKNAETPLDGLPKAERTNLITTAMQGAMLAHFEELGDVYGAKNMRKKSELEEIGKKIAFQMAQQCPSYLVMLGVDGISGK